MTMKLAVAPANTKMGRRTLRLSDLSIRGEQRAHAFLFLLPTAVLLLAFVGYPLVYSVLLTFSGTSALPGRLGVWAGFANWAHLASDPVFIQSFEQSIMYVVPSCLIGVPLGLAIALILNQDFPGNGIARACLLVPWALPPVVVAAMFQWLLSTQRGVLGLWLTQLGITAKPPIFFGGIPTTLYVLVGINIWKTLPLLAIMFLVALQYLPAETMQAARIDGATMWRRFRYVVVPHLRPTVVAALIVELLLTLQLFDLIFALTLGGPGAYSTYDLYFYAYKTTFEYNSFGYGAVVGYVVSALVIGFALLLTRGRALRSSGGAE